MTSSTSSAPPRRPSLRSIEERNKLVEANADLVGYVLGKVMGGRHGSEDLRQAGMIGLIRGAELFEPERGYRFSTYAVWWIRQAITHALATEHDADLIRIPERAPRETRSALRARLRCRPLPVVVTSAGVEADALPGPEGPDPDHKLDVGRLLRVLDRRSRRLVEGYYLQGRTLQEVGRRHGLTRERIRQLLARALAKMRESVRDT